LSADLPITSVNHPPGPHAFDLLDDSERSGEIVKQALTFLRVRLSAAR
jgi:hypothetical protein